MWAVLVLAVWACLGVCSEGSHVFFDDGKLSGKRVVFVSVQSYSIGKQELPVMRELRARGASVEFWGNMKLWKLMESADFKASGMRDLLNPDSLAHLVHMMQQPRLLNPKSREWLRYAQVFSKVLEEMLADVYPTVVDGWSSYVNATGVPDLLVLDFFSVAIMDWANTHKVPFVVYHAGLLGVIGGYADTFALPDSFAGYTIAEHQTSFKARLMKIAHVVGMITSSMTVTNKLNAHRAKYGFVQYMPPTGMWDGRHVIVTWDAYSNVPRMTSPLVHFVGLLSGTAPFNKTATPIDTLPETDQEIWAWLDQRQSGGVVYIAFGTEAFPSHEEFSKILSGVRSFCTKHNASALLALRPNLRKHLTEAVIGASAVGGDIRVVDWVTQEMVLSHPAIRVFVTHGGQGSSGEAILSGVPLLMVPFFGDQPWNTIRMEEAGVALGIDHHNFTAEEVSAKLHRLASEPSFRQSVGRLRDLNLVGSGPASRAADVIESELLVHSSQLLRPIESVTPWYITYGVDVLGTLLAAVLVILYTVYKVLRSILSLLLGGQSTANNSALSGKKQQ